MDPDFAGDSTDCFVGDVRRSCITCFRFFSAINCSLTHMTSATYFCAFSKASLLVSSFLLTATHGCIPALSWPMTGRPRREGGREGGREEDLCSGSASAASNIGFVAKQADSILGSAFPCCCTISNCKKLPNTMCYCRIALRPFGICIVDAGQILKTLKPISMSLCIG